MITAIPHQWRWHHSTIVFLLGLSPNYQIVELPNCQIATLIKPFSHSTIVLLSPAEGHYFTTTTFPLLITPLSLLAV